MTAGQRLTLVEAECHIGNPVYVDQPGLAGACDEGRITAVDNTRRLVQVRLRRRAFPYDLTTRTVWCAPCRLSIPQWWRDRQEARS